MLKLRLTLGERLMANRILNERGQGLTLTTLRMALKIADKTEVDQEEMDIAKKNLPKDDINNSWKDEGTEKEIELSDDQKKLFIEFIDKKDSDKNYSIDEGKFMIQLIDKVKGEKDA